jgi:hypothetical protein
MKERKVLSKHVKECLLHGEIDNELFMEHNCWKVNLTRIVAGMRVKVVTALDPKTKVVVVTVIKE